MNTRRIWFITGSSLGFGRSMTEAALQAGDAVIATVRRPESLADLQKVYPEEKLLVVKLDVTKKDEITAAFKKAKEFFGRIDVVYNNAGYAFAGEAEAVPEEDARGLFDTNFWGSCSVAREAIAFFRDVNKPVGGRLIQMCSYYGLIAGGAMNYYVASKHAMDGFTECLSKEIDPAWNIKISLVEPSLFRTNFIRDRSYKIYAHPLYTNPTVEGVAFRMALDQLDPQSVKGDPDKLSQTILKLSRLDNPPLRLVLGKDAVAKVKAKLRQMQEELEQYEEWSADLDFNE
ncbi:NAD-P-bindingprotein [Moniliophthora roreri MCA 2997]|uniref:NAD-P-bindingprotein n=2 Tax=Moniliophthora roreri TaxID=221103 RepID=V2WLJ5_MONRO|nr:NAD-P-bindingprotein [Moniliophthora roreri MCA 2997]KAI3609789.1 NAD-P-bindingprotein [Moniliophthora roreri]